jgi:hypothetical protein
MAWDGSGVVPLARTVNPPHHLANVNSQGSQYSRTVAEEPHGIRAFREITRPGRTLAQGGRTNHGPTCLQTDSVGLLAMLENEGQDFDHLAIAAWRSQQAILQNRNTSGS